MAQCESCATVFRALGDRHRLQIIRYLRRSQQAVTTSELLEILDVAQPTLAHHMKLLAHVELVIVNRQGRCVSYELNREKFNHMGECLTAITKKCDECTCPGEGCCCGG